MLSSKDLLKEISSKIKEKGIIDEEFAKYLESIYPDRSPDILESIRRGITKYIYKPSKRSVWIASGQYNIYLIYPKKFCSCHDFYKNVIIKRKRPFCKHIIAQLIVETLNNFQTLELEDNEFKELIKDLSSEEDDFSVV